MSNYQKTTEAVSKLTPEQYSVTQEAATEPAFRNQYWDNHEQGIYVDIVSGEPLFASIDKFESGSGWPSCTVPLDPANIVEKKKDRSCGMTRIEVRSTNGDSHLGHMFDDGSRRPGRSALLHQFGRDALRPGRRHDRHSRPAPGSVIAVATTKSPTRGRGPAFVRAARGCRSGSGRLFPTWS